DLAGPFDDVGGHAEPFEVWTAGLVRIGIRYRYAVRAHAVGPHPRLLRLFGGERTVSLADPSQGGAPLRRGLPPGRVLRGPRVLVEPGILLGHRVGHVDGVLAHATRPGDAAARGRASARTRRGRRVFAVARGEERQQERDGQHVADNHGFPPHIA